MANVRNTTDYILSYEDYYDYEDLVSFDENELQANKYSIVIAFWVGLAVFVVFLYLILLYMSRTDHEQHHRRSIVRKENHSVSDRRQTKGAVDVSQGGREEHLLISVIDEIPIIKLSSTPQGST